MRRYHAGLSLVALVATFTMVPSPSHFLAAQPIRGGVPVPRTPPYDLLFSVGDVAKTLYGRILVADPHEGTFYTLDRSLRVVGATGGLGGRQPGLFRALRSLRSLGSVQYALDRQLRRLYLYTPTVRATLPMWVSLDFEPVDICPISRERVVVLGERDGNMLHEIDVSSGRVIRSGVPSDPLIVDPDDGGLPDGWMSCDAGATEYLITWSGYPIVDAIDVRSLHRVSRELITNQAPDQELSAFGRAFTYMGERVIQATPRSDSYLTPDSVFLFRRGLQSQPRVLTGHTRLFPLGGDSAVLVTGVRRFTLEFVRLSEFLRDR